MNAREFLARLRRRLFYFQVALLLVSACAVAFAAMRTFETDLNADITRKGELIARSLAGQIGHAVAHDIPFEQLPGMPQLFATLRAHNQEFLFIVAGNADASVLRVSGPVAREALVDAFARLAAPASADAQPPLPFLMTAQQITVDNLGVGWVIVGFDAQFVRQRITQVLLDVLVVLLVSLLVTFELVLLIMANAAAPSAALQAALDRLRRRHAALIARAEGLTLDGPAQHRLQTASAALAVLTDRCRGGIGAHGQTLIRVRLPLFAFFTAEELSRPFFPVFARQLCAGVPGMSPELAISVPMTLFLLVVAALQPVAGPWAQRLGARNLLIVGAVIGAAGLALTATAANIWALLAWRLVTAVGYGLVFVAGQSHVVQNTEASNRAWGLAMFVGSVLAASICGPALGGLLAAGIGSRPTFAIGSLLALAAGLAAFRLLPPAAEGQGPARPLRWADAARLLHSRRFVALVVLAAMPAKIILTGFLYYLAPLLLSELGAGSASAGRTMMLYGLMMVLATPVTARLVDRIGQPLRFVIAGGLVSAVGLALVVLLPGMQTMVAAIVLLGLAQAVSLTPQLSLVPQACPEACSSIGQITVIGFFRLGERIGSALGPAIAAVLLHAWGFYAAIGVLAGAAAIGCCALGVLWGAWPRRQRGAIAVPGLGGVNSNG